VLREALERYLEIAAGSSWSLIARNARASWGLTEADLPRLIAEVRQER
jgi:hypothetical protein